MKLQKKGFLLKKTLLLLLILFIAGCEEKMPVRIEPENVAEVFLEMTRDNLVIFKPGIRNIFDDTFDANPYIDGHIMIWLETGEFIKELHFHCEDIQTLTVDTQRTAWAYAYWDLTDYNGDAVWTYSPSSSSVNLKAAARIKFYQRVPSIYSDTLKFTLNKDEAGTRGTRNFLGVDFEDINHCWVTGTDGKIFLYKDTLCIREEQESHTAADLNDVVFFDTLNGLCIGNHGTVLYTENGGNNWTDGSVPFYNDLNRLFFITDEIGWAVGDSGIILNTTDGGRNWQERTSGTVVNLYGIHFSSMYFGLAVGELGTILATEDGGNTWILFRRLYTYCLKDVYIGSRMDRIIVAGSEGSLLYFDYLNRRWSYGAPRYDAPNGINRMFFYNSNRGWTACNDGIICKIGSYFSKYLMDPPVCMNDIEFTDFIHGVAVGDDNRLLFSSNGGSSWHKVEPMR